MIFYVFIESVGDIVMYLMLRKYYLMILFFFCGIKDFLDDIIFLILLYLLYKYLLICLLINMM